MVNKLNHCMVLIIYVNTGILLFIFVRNVALMTEEGESKKLECSDYCIKLQ